MIQKIVDTTFTDPVPGFYDYSSPDAGQSGFRLLVQDNDSLHSPYNEGFDIADGVAAIVGIKAKQIVHLPYPYTDCSTEDKEKNRLAHSIQQKLGDSFEEKISSSAGIVESAYRTGNCR